MISKNGILAVFSFEWKTKNLWRKKTGKKKILAKEPFWVILNFKQKAPFIKKPIFFNLPLKVRICYATLIYIQKKEKKKNTE